MISWFARNSVAANLLMASIILLGIAAIKIEIPLEVFPSVELNTVNVQVSLRGAQPEEVEETIAVRIEEAVFDLEGVKEIRSRSTEGSATVTIELEDDADTQVLLDDIKNRVDAINNFPVDAEKPIITRSSWSREVISVVVFGDVAPRQLRQIAERTRDELLALPGVTQVSLDGVKNFEIGIEIPQQTLNEYQLTLEQVGQAIRRGSVDLSAGSIKTSGGEVLIRTKTQAYNRADYESIVIVTADDGTQLTLGDLGRVKDEFEENALDTDFDGQPAILIEVNRVGNQSALEVAGAVKDYIEKAGPRLPGGVEISYWRDRSEILKARLSTLIDSAIQGGILILLLLALFLHPKVALWVFVGIPIAFAGGFILMPMLGVSLNLLSLFAFILVLGIVVDDAIVTGENIYQHMRQKEDPLRAAIEGTKEVALPVTFGILTTVAAFLPLLFIEGRRSIFFSSIPLIVIPVLLFSLVESKLILPAHLSHVNIHKKGRFDGLLRVQRKIADGFESFVLRYYRPLLKFAINHKALTLATFTGGGIIILAMVFSGWTKFIFFPRIQSELARASITMPAGTAFEVTDSYVERMTVAAQQLQEKYVDPNTGESVISHILSTSGSSGGRGAQSNQGRVIFEVVSPEERTLDVTSSQLVREWREAIGVLPGVETMNFRAEIGRSSDPIDIQLRGNDIEQMQQLSANVKEQLATYANVFDIADSMSDGKEELQLQLKPQAETLGISVTDLARQMRNAVFGFEVQRIQRGRDDIRVMLRLPLEERQSLSALENFYIETPQGSRVAFSEVASLKPGVSSSVINRVDRYRVVSITADLNKELANPEVIQSDIEQFIKSELVNYPDVYYTFEGEAREQREAFGGLLWGTLFVFFIIYCLLAIPFKSYFKPFVVLAIIPFGALAAVVGHWIMGMDLSVMSLMGMLALTGVVVNDSLVLVDYISKRRAEGMSLEEAVLTSGVRRFRPVILTSLTTFMGLMPLIFEKSTQAQFLIPMAVSLGFGILLSTFVTLILVPTNYALLSRAKSRIIETFTKTKPIEA